MTIKINQKIIGYQVKKDNGDIEIIPKDEIQFQQMNESIIRPELLLGSTYKIKVGAMEHALYLTINDMILNPDTEHEHRSIYEVFINTKENTHFQWITALTRLISAVFRKGGDVVFMVEELKQVFDSQGGLRERSILHPSLVAKIGSTIESHMVRIGMIERQEVNEYAAQLIKEKVEAHESRHGKLTTDDDGYPKQARRCDKCGHRSIMRLDNCDTCLNSECNFSKCG